MTILPITEMINTIVLSLSVYIIYRLILFIRNKHASNKRHDYFLNKASEVKTKRDNLINEFVSKYKLEITKEDIITICGMSLRQLSLAIKERKITARKAFLCYALNCSTVGATLNSITDVNFEKELKEAEKADEIIINSTSKDKLPKLIGVPISIKDHIPVKDYLETAGLCSKYNNRVEFNSDLVIKLKELGAIVLCKSNVCQGIMSAESSNNFWGENKNIYDSRRTTGGSSGGEGSLISSFSSPIGIGSDIAGSIRIPSMFNGVYGFKPTSTKLIRKNILTLNGDLYSSWNIWPVSIGYFGRSLDDIVFMSEILFGEFKNQDDAYNIDHRVFNNNLYTSNEKLKIMYLYERDDIEILSDMKESIVSSLEYLKSKGHEIIKFDYKDIDKFYYLGYEMLLNGDTLSQIQRGLDGEKPYYFYDEFILLSSLPNWIYKPLSYILNLLGEKRDGKLIGKIRKHSNFEENFQRTEEFYKEKNNFLTYLKDNKIDALIFPVYPFSAPLIGNAKMTNSTAFYNFIISMIDSPSINVPTGIVKSTDIISKVKYNDSLSKMIINDVSSSKNLPVGFQIAAYPGKDEVCLRIAKEIQENIKDYPYNKILEDNLQTKNFWKYRNLN